MDDNQFIELINIITTGLESINDNLKKIIDSRPISNNVVCESKDDYDGIPLSSVHHPDNPEYKNDRSYHWDNEVKMWRRK